LYLKLFYEGGIMLKKSEIKESREKLTLYTEKDTCVCCGKYVPEGRMVCQECEERNYNGREEE